MFVDVTFDAEEELGRNGPTHKHNFRHFPRIQNRTNNQNETTVYMAHAPIFFKQKNNISLRLNFS